MRSTAIRPLALSAALGLALVAAACGGGPPAATPAAFTVDGTEFGFSPATLTAPAGEIKVTLVNKGIVEHDFTIDALSAHIHANAGETSEGSFTAAAGTYTFYCSVAGHRQAGMEGTLTVR